jgi:hypothetical protein
MATAPATPIKPRQNAMKIFKITPGAQKEPGF